MTDPIVGDWEKEVLFVGVMKCRFYPNGTGLAKGKILGHTIDEYFLWEGRGNSVYYIKAHGEEHDILLCGNKLETEFRGLKLEMNRICEV